MKKTKLPREVLLHYQGFLCRSKNRILANYYLNSLEVLTEALRDAKILCRSPEVYFNIRRQIIEMLWSIRNSQRIGQFSLLS